MKRLLSFVLLVSCLLVSGCGGGGVSLSIFAGTWVGTYGVPLSGDTGDIILTVNTTGQFTGNYQSTVDGSVTGSLTGAIQNNGNISGNDIDLSGSTPFSGTVSLTGGGTSMTGTINESVGGFTVAISFTLAKQ